MLPWQRKCELSSQQFCGIIIINVPIRTYTNYVLIVWTVNETTKVKLYIFILFRCQNTCMGTINLFMWSCWVLLRFSIHPCDLLARVIVLEFTFRVFYPPCDFWHEWSWWSLFLGFFYPPFDFWHEWSCCSLFLGFFILPVTFGTSNRAGVYF